jgi:hypothetical protein
MKTKQSAYNCRCRCNSLTKLSLSKPLLKCSTIKMTILSLIILPYEIISLMPSMSPPFTMRRPPYIGFERPNHLRDSWDRLRIFLHQLWILPKIQALTSDSNQTDFRDKGDLPLISSTTQRSPRMVHRALQCSPKGRQGALALPASG